MLLADVVVNVNRVTFCVGIVVRDGIVALADSRIVRGHVVATKSKLTVVDLDGCDIVVMTSGLRSLRDKVMQRITDDIDADRLRCRSLHEFASAFGAMLQQTRAEDETALQRSGLSINLNAVIAGQLTRDREPQLIHIYPEGNWVTATAEAPYVTIGRSAYAQPFLDRLVNHECPLGEAVTAAFVAFDATCSSVTEVDYPIHVAVISRSRSGVAVQAVYERDDLAEASRCWTRHLRDGVTRSPADWSALEIT